MILLLPFLYLVLCFFTQTFQFEPKWGLAVIIIGAFYDVIMRVCKTISRIENENQK